MDIGNHHLWWLGCATGLEGLIMNQPAFPQSIQIANEFHPNYGKDTGMTLRDYFAAKAMQPLIVSFTVQDINWTSKQAYKIADAMLEARKA